MAEYQLTLNEHILRVADNVFIPADPLNRHYQEYLGWIEDGGVPDPYTAPEPVLINSSPEQQLLFDHENRLRAQEGSPPLTLEDFTKELSG